MCRRPAPWTVATATPALAMHMTSYCRWQGIELHPAMVGFLCFVWMLVPLGMAQSARRGELYDLQGQISFYRSYHSDPINSAIHFICIPLILWSTIGLFAASAPFLGAGSVPAFDFSLREPCSPAFYTVSTSCSPVSANTMGCLRSASPTLRVILLFYGWTSIYR